MNDRIDAVGVYVIKQAHEQLHWVHDILEKIEYVIAKYAPDFDHWLYGGDSMEGMNPLDPEKYIFEKVYMTPDYKMVTARIDKDGFLSFEKEEFETVTGTLQKEKD